jgi:aminopeptidase N
MKYWNICLFLVYLVLTSHNIFGQETDKDFLLIKKGWKQFSDTRAIVGLTSDYDVNYYRLDLSANPAVRFISGSVTTYFKPKVSNFNVIHFNLMNNMQVDSVVYHGNLVTSYSFLNSTTLQITFPNTLPQNVNDSLRVYYQGIPINDGFGSFGLGTNSCTNNKVMWTLSEPYGARNWWPCKQTLDDKADSLDVIVTCPVPYRAAANGLLVTETTNPNNTKTYRWKHRYPIPAYLVAFAIADYQTYSNYVPVSGNPPIEVLNYVYQCNTTAATQTPNIIPIMQFFINKLGEYPYSNEKYGHAQCNFGGGMEHSTMSFMGSFSKFLMAHELAHQWFGDKITCGSWQDIWLNEGFATYMEGLTCEQGIGDYFWNDWKLGKISSVTSYNTGSTYVTDTTNVGNIFSNVLVYNKGALILHMLRWKLGDQVFFDGLHDYINDPQLSYNFAKSPDFKAVMEAASGINLTEFFNDWLYGQGFPNYNIQWSKDVNCNKVYVTITQTHSANQGTFFEMPVALRFTNGTVSDTIVFDQNSPLTTTFNHQLSFNPTSVSFDPDKWLCAKAVVTQVAFNNQRHIVWTGAQDNNWHNAANWDCGIPTALDDVTITDGTNACIIYNGSTADCKSLKVENSGSLTTQPHATLNIHN